MQVIPAVDVLAGRVVRLLRGDYDAVTGYGDDAVDVASAWVTSGAGLVHVVDLDGARVGSPDAALWRRMGDAGVPFQVGGGLRRLEDVTAAIEFGARRAVVGTAAVWNHELLAEMAARVGGDRIVAALDVRDGMAMGAGWLDEGRPLADVLAGVTEAGIHRVLVTAINRDGTMEGPDTGLLREVAGTLQAGVIASGGVGSLRDIRELATTGVEAAIVGRALYEGRFTLEEAISAAGAAPAPE